MKGKCLVLLLLMSAIAEHLFSQQVMATAAKNGNSLRGTITDKDSKTPLENCTIVILQARDSMLVKFAYSGPSGAFAMNNLPSGKFILLVSYPKFADYVQAFTLDSANTQLDFGAVGILPKSKLLEEVIVRGQVTLVKLRGDTTEYNVKDFKVQPNAKVEDLLKQLPGVTVDQDGHITAQGQVVNRVLVDGEEFFGDDPTLVTRNIRADMVEKVQVFDKKSDQAVLTGIDDGRKEKTINLKIKEDKKQGYFGKLEAGGGTDGYYKGQALFNSFKGNRKFSIYGLAGNDGKTGLGWQDNARYTSSIVDMAEPGVIVDMSGGDELETFDGRYNGQGIPQARSGGLHYDNKWSEDKNAINFNYKIGSLRVEGENDDAVQNNLPAAVFYRNSERNFNNYLFRQKGDITYRTRIDSLSDLKLMIEGTLKRSEIANDFKSAGTDGEGNLLNKELRSVNNVGDLGTLNARLFYTKKFRKPGRTLSLNLLELLNKNDVDGYLRSRVEFYDETATVDSLQEYDQYKTNILRSSEFHANLAFSERLSKTMAVVLNYGMGLGQNKSALNTFNKVQGKYTQLDSLFSNSYELKQYYNQAGAIFNYNKGKSLLNFGSKVSFVNFEQLNIFNKNLFKRDFVNWYPQASFQYQLSKQAFARLGYTGNTILPTISQLQPVVINTDPLNIVVGNPDLEPSLNNQFNISYQSFNPLTNQLVGIFGRYNFITDAGVRSVFTDPAGKSTMTTVNLSGTSPWAFNLGIYFDRKIKWLKMDMGINVTSDLNTYYAISNNALNKLRYHTYTLQVRGNKMVPNKYDFNFSLGPTYTVSGASLQPDIDNNGKGINANGGINIYLPGKFQVSSSVNYKYLEATETFNEDFSRITWNASLIKLFGKARNLKLSLTGYDLLNQNVGFNRSISGYLVMQSSYTTIQRYFMLSLTYDFTKAGNQTKK